MPDDPSVLRHWLLLKELAAARYGLTVREMADRAGVNDKTIRRDLALFQRLGFALEETVGDFGRKTWKLKPGATLPSLGFTCDEALALYLGRRLLEVSLAGTPFWQPAQNAFRKVRAALAPSALDYLHRCSAFFHLTACGAHDYTRHCERLDALLLAMEDAKAVHINYRSERATEPAFRDVYPYGWIGHKHALYLVALDPTEQQVKTYKLDRIEDVELTNFPFPRPSDFSLSALLRGSFGMYHADGDVTVKVRFAPAVVRYVEEARWHPSQRLTRQRDGGVVAEWRLSGTNEIKSWVLGFGRKAVVLEPAELRREIADELRALLAAYSAPAPRDQPAFLPGTTTPT